MKNNEFSEIWKKTIPDKPTPIVKVLTSKVLTILQLCIKINNYSVWHIPKYYINFL